MAVATRSEKSTGILPPQAQKRADLWKSIKRNRWAYLFISPFFIIFAVFGVFPPLYGFFVSFFSWDLLTPMRFVGLSNYGYVFSDGLFWKSVGNVILFTVAEGVPEVILALLIAYLLDTYVIKSRNIYLAAFFSPSVTSSVAVAIVFGAIFGLNYGLVNSVLRSVNIQPVEWLTQAVPLKIVLIILLLWRWLGWNIVINLAGLQTIPHEYYEAAVVDGANRFQIFVRITVPLMKQVILYTTITTIIGTLQLFAEPRLLTTAAGILGGRNNSLLTPVMYIYQMGFGYFRFGYASAIAYVFFVIVLGASILNLRFINQKD
jgi:ABC-type sugar transport system permease subunit